MDSYGEFAGIYDRLMDDFDYPRWAEYYLEIIARTGVKMRRICDCACGTGSMSVEFAKRGLNVTGVDLSEDMLRIASVKARRNALKMVFACQNMSSLTLPRPVDAVICACDGVNYLTTDEALTGFFTSAYNSIKDGGCLAFDISSRHKLENIIGSGFFGEERDDVAYLWSNSYNPSKHMVQMDITFFAQEKNGLYRRFNEVHHQVWHDPEQLRAQLEAAGFENICIYGDQTFTAPEPDEQRIHISARKK